MKKFILLLILSAAFLSYASADVIPPDMHAVIRTITVSNCNAYSAVTLVGYVTGPMISGYEVFTITENTPIVKGYKMNVLKVFALSTAYIQAQGGIANIDFTAIINKVTPVEIMDPAPKLVYNTSPVIAEKVIYTIAGYNSNNELILYISQRTLEYNNGTPPKVENYQYIP